MSNKWTKMLKSYEDTVNFEYDAFAPENCLYTPSPYVNWTFANKSHGIPKNSSVLMYSEQKAGKSMMMQAIIGEMHQRDKEGIAICFNTEMRGKFQSGMFETIDKDRLVVYDSNRPEDIFDRFEKEILPMVQDGMPLRIVCIDSLTAVGGTKAQDASRSVNDHLMGDHALTINKGLDKIVPYCKRHGILLIASSQMRANLDANSNIKEKMAESWKVKHTFEYFLSIKRATAADDKKNLAGEEFTNATVKDARGNKDITGHKIYFKMEASSIGTAGRAGVLTLDYKKGFINQHEEVFLLGRAYGIVGGGASGNYTLEGEKIKGAAAVAEKIKNDPALAARIVEEVKRKEAAGDQANETSESVEK